MNKVLIFNDQSQIIKQIFVRKQYEFDSFRIIESKDLVKITITELGIEFNIIYVLSDEKSRKQWKRIFDDTIMIFYFLDESPEILTRLAKGEWFNNIPIHVITCNPTVLDIKNIHLHLLDDDIIDIIKDKSRSMQNLPPSPKMNVIQFLRRKSQSFTNVPKLTETPAKRSDSVPLFKNF